MNDKTALNGDSLAWYARAIYRCRYFFLLMLLSGLAFGGWQVYAEPDFRTIANLRLKNDLLDYQHRAYWDPQGRKTMAQVRGVAGELAQDATISVKQESDPWLLRLDIMHQNSGAGELLVQQILLKLRQLNRSVEPNPDSKSSVGANGSENKTRRLVDLLDQMEIRLSQLNVENLSLDTSKASDPILPQSFRVSADYIVRWPLDQLPQAHRFAEVQQRIDQYFKSVSQKPTQERDVAVENELLSLQEKAVMQMLQMWGRMELSAAATSENQIVCDSVYEQPIDLWQQSARELFLWSCLAVGIAILIIVPWVWCIDHWRIITGK
jgi:hypothetical protein